MKKNLKKMSLKKSAISNLTVGVIGGKARSGGPLTCTDPTARTFCFHCPPKNPF